MPLTPWKSTESNNTVSPKPELIPADYSVVDANPVTIPFENGAATQTDVTFTYAAPVIPTEGTVTFRFVDGQGNPLRDAVQTTVANGVYTDLSVYQAAIDGYDCIGVSANQLTVENGVASPAEVFFTYQRKPVNGKVRVVYHGRRRGVQQRRTPADRAGRKYRQPRTPVWCPLIIRRWMWLL